MPPTSAVGNRNAELLLRMAFMDVPIPNTTGCQVSIQLTVLKISILFAKPSKHVPE